ncbi:chromatin modification- protein VID21 [Xylographa soralifera]|nr:chromatin modification- protein VID21 [Xylographa soralifera]
MIRDAILKTKRDELGNCITSRKRKLQELYYATVSYARPLPPKRKPDANDLQTYGEADFLDANNILEGKSFDPTTLRRVPEAELTNYNNPVTPSTKVQQRLELQDHETEPASYDSDTIVLQGRLPGENSASSRSGREQNENDYLPTSNSTLQEAQAGRASPKAAIDINGENSIRDADVDSDLQPLGAGRDGAKKPFLWPSDPQNVDTGSQPRLEALVKDDLSSLEGSTPLGTVHGFQGSSLIRAQPSDVVSHEQSDAVIRVPEESLEDFSEIQVHDGNSGSAQGPLGTSGVSKRVLQAPATNGPHSVEHLHDVPGSKVADAETTTDGLSVADSELRLEEPQFLKPTHNLKMQAENETLPSVEGGTINNVKKVDQFDRSCNLTGDSRLLERRSQPFQERMMPGTTREISKDVMFSQRPPMRIDTGVSSLKGSMDSFEKPRLQGSIDSQTPSSSSTPLKATPTTAHPSPPERMTTRVSSGALRHKSVSEILGETPRSGTHQGDKTPAERVGNDLLQDISGQHTPRYGQLVASPESVSFRSRLSELKEREKERSKLSTVVFARQQPLDYVNNSELSLQKMPGSERVTEQDKDYLLTLFTAQASAQQPSLNALLGSAHKALTTSNHYLDFHEQQDCRILKRIYHLQNSNRWSLRQLARSQEPQRPTTQWDVLLAHMKWMQTDFREERKWKLAAAKNIADWCAEWVASSSARRLALQVRLTSNNGKTRDSDGHATPVSLANNGESSRSDTTPELVPSGEDDLSDVLGESTPILGAFKTPAPAAIFSLAPEDVIFQLDKTPVSQKLLAELPLYEPWNNLADVDVIADSQSVDKNWKTSLLPISKFATGKMIIRSPAPSRKRSRYEFDDDDDDEEDLCEPTKPSPLTFSGANEPVPPEIDDVALFNPENKHIIDRLHAAHAFRPPSEFSMPSQSFFESRNCSQWTWAEDDELRKLVREYAYNWSLISSSLTSPSLFSSGAERRTPWECFERWVSFEGLPGDMNRTQYFRTWYSRRDAARTLLNQQIAAQQQQQAGNSSQTQVRRRTAEPTRVERRRNSKHLALIHAMQKVAKKKETTLQKQQHVASLAAMRKATEATQPRQRMQTPQEFSRFKHERECRMQEKQELYRQQMLAQQRAAFMQKANQQSGQSQANPNIPNQARNGISTSMSTSPHLATSLPHNVMPPGSSQNRPIPLTNGMLPNGVQPSGGQTNIRGGGIPQAPMQSQMLGPQRIPHDMRVILEATRVQQEQQYLAAQRQQRYPRSNGVNSTSSSPQPTSMNTSQANAAMLANLQATNGKLSPAPNGISVHPRTSASPRLANAVQAQQLSNGVTPMVNQIANQMKARHPNASPEQIRQLATDHLNQQLRSQNSQAAMQAAAGSGLGLNGTGTQQGLNFGNTMLNPQMYAQSMHFQQQTQQNHNRVGSMNGGGKGKAQRVEQSVKQSDKEETALPTTEKSTTIPPKVQDITTTQANTADDKALLTLSDDEELLFHPKSKVTRSTDVKGKSKLIPVDDKGDGVVLALPPPVNTGLFLDDGTPDPQAHLKGDSAGEGLAEPRPRVSPSPVPDEDVDW